MYQINGIGLFIKAEYWVPWEFAILFCRKVGIDVPAHLQVKEAEYDKRYSSGS